MVLSCILNALVWYNMRRDSVARLQVEDTMSLRVNS